MLALRKFMNVRNSLISFVAVQNWQKDHVIFLSGKSGTIFG